MLRHSRHRNTPVWARAEVLVAAVGKDQCRRQDRRWPPLGLQRRAGTAWWRRWRCAKALAPFLSWQS